MTITLHSVWNEAHQVYPEISGLLPVGMHLFALFHLQSMTKRWLQHARRLGLLDVKLPAFTMRRFALIRLRAPDKSS